jgi:hypothetical protein
MRNPSHESRVCASEYRPGPAHKKTWLAVLLGLATVSGLQAMVLDNFNGPKTGWTDTLNGGSVLQSGGEFTVTTANPGGSLTYSKKTSSSFTNAAGYTLEFRVDLDSVTPGTANTNPLAILAWVPAGDAVLAGGYSISVGAADVLIQKGGTILYATNFTAAGTNLQNANITIALRMTSSGSAVTVNARVYKRIANGLIGQYFTTLFEYTVVDSAGLIGGAGGNAALGVKNQASAGGAAAAFSNLQVFDTVTTVLDTFSSGTLDTTKWTVYKKNPGLGDSVTVGPSGLDILATVADPSGGFAALYTANTTYTIVDGGQVEFQLDIVNNLTGDANGYSALGYLPAANPTYINGIIEYHVAHDIIGHTTVVNGKGYNEWWGGRNDIQPPYAPPGCRYTLTMTGEGSNCRIETRIEDLSVADVNNPARLVWQTEFVDTPAADPGLNEDTLGNLAPYLNSPDGRFAISTFNSGAVPVAFGGTSPNWAEVIYSNAVVRQTLPGKTAPILANVVPAYSANFLASTNVLSFDASDAANLPLSGLSITLNGVTYANGSPGVTITPSGSTSTTRHFALAGALTANVNYVGSAQATDANGLSTSFPLVFDTFLTNDYVIEAEEFNFSADGGVSGGAFIDNPVLIADGTSNPNAYNGQTGIAEVDYHDNRGPGTGVQDANHTFRWNDPVYTSHSSDPARAKYVNAGGISAGYYETEVTDIYDGDWLNYTHTYPAGTYNVFLRQATFKLLNSLVTLERVTGDPTTTSQTNTILGNFAASPTGIGLFVNVPLTDGTGNPVVLRFSGGVDTLQLHNRVTGNANLDVGSLEQNYLVLVPVADPGTLRPAVSLVTPSANSTLNSAAPVTTAAIANRDTSVNLASIILQINGSTVAATITPTNNGAYVSYALPYPLPAPNSMLTNTLIFKDSGNVFQTNTWTWMLAYTYLPAANSLPVGSLSVPGFDARMVQSSAANMGGTGGLNNSMASALAVLAIPPQYPVDLTSASVVQNVAWDLNGSAFGATANFPGLCLPPANINSFAVETFAYLQLTAGLHRFYVDSDDTVGFYSGTNVVDKSIVLLETTGVVHQSFDFIVGADGLYPFHIVYQQGGGGAYLVLNSVNLSNGTTNLVNSAGGVNAYYPLVCQSSASLAGPFTADPAANAGNVITTAGVSCDGTGTALNQSLTGGTVTVPISGSAKLYRLDGPRSSKITGITKNGSNVVITYQAQ